MPIVSYIKECTSFIAFASDNGITANEFVLWHALLNIFNQRANGNVWSDGFIPVSNSRLLSFTPFGCGNSAVETLRKTRDRLIQRGLIRYQAGQRNKAKPLYQMVYFCAREEAPAPDVENVCAASDGGNVTQKLLGNIQGKPLGNMQDKPLGNPLDIYIDYNYNGDREDYSDTPYPENTQSHTTTAVFTRARGGLPWYDPNDPDAACDESYRDSDKARAAIAGRILDFFPAQVMSRDSENIHGLMCDAMKAGVHPSLIQHAAAGCGSASQWERAILKAAKQIGVTFDSARRELYDLKLRTGITDDEARDVLRNRRYISAVMTNLA